MFPEALAPISLYPVCGVYIRPSASTHFPDSRRSASKHFDLNDFPQLSEMPHTYPYLKYWSTFEKPFGSMHGNYPARRRGRTSDLSRRTHDYMAFTPEHEYDWGSIHRNGAGNQPASERHAINHSYTRYFCSPSVGNSGAELDRNTFLTNKAPLGALPVTSRAMASVTAVLLANTWGSKRF